jgi:hypothetical protein
MHNLKLIRRHFPKQAGSIILGLALLSASALAIGLGLLLLR